MINIMFLSTIPVTAVTRETNINAQRQYICIHLHGLIFRWDAIPANKSNNLVMQKTTPETVQTK